MNIEEHNFRQIEALNQRGGRTLSLVDLVEAGTLSVEMAAWAMRAVRLGASVLSGAGPGGAGKTTLMAALLHLLPPDVVIHTVDRPGVLAEARTRPPDEPACYLVHEIGSGHYYGYLWGPDVADFVSLVGGSRRIASCLHADTLDELTDLLCTQPLAVRQEALGRVGLILFIRAERREGKLIRRVASVYEADGRGGHRLVFRWNRETDTFERGAAPEDPTGLTVYVELLERLLADGVTDARQVRRRTLEFYAG